MAAERQVAGGAGSIVSQVKVERVALGGERVGRVGRSGADRLQVGSNDVRAAAAVAGTGKQTDVTGEGVREDARVGRRPGEGPAWLSLDRGGDEAEQKRCPEVR